MCKLSAGLDASGALVGLQVRLSGQSINAYVSPQTVVDGKDKRQLQGWWEEPGDAQLGYSVPNLRVEYAMRNSHVPVGPWRGVNTNQNGVYMECFIDEVARAAKADSLEFRRRLMGKHPKHRAVLNAAAERAGWSTPLPPGVHRGIAQFMGYGSYSAAVAEVSVSPAGVLEVHRMVLALDCGHAVNPDQIAAQVEGSVAYGLSAALYGEISIERGRAVELNFHNYPVLRLAAMPKVETVIVPTYDFWGGVGEPTICVVTPCVLNAIHAATGKPVRSLPLRHSKLVRTGAGAGRLLACRAGKASGVIGQDVEVLDRDLADGFGHGLAVARPGAGAKAAQAHLEIVLALAFDAWHLRAAGQVGAVAEHALVLQRQRLAFFHARGIGRCCRRWRRHRRQRADEVGIAAQVVVGQRLRHRGHRSVAAPAFPKQEELGDRIERRLTGQHRNPRHVAAPVGPVAGGALGREPLGVGDSGGRCGGRGSARARGRRAGRAGRLLLRAGSAGEQSRRQRCRNADAALHALPALLHLP